MTRSQLALAFASVLFYVFCVTSAVAAQPDRSAAAVPRTGDHVSALKPEDRHGDYLKQVETAPVVDPDLNAAIFDKSISDEMKAKFRSFDSPYQAREVYRLNTQADYVNYEKANKDLAEWTIKKLLQYHFENTITRNVEEGVKREARESKSGSSKAAAQAVATLSHVQKALKNTTLDISENTKTRFKYDFPSGLVRMGMTSPIVDATMDYRLKAADPVVGAVSQPEKLSMSMSSRFPWVETSASANYGLISQTLNYGLSRHLVGPLSAQTDRTHNMRDTTKDETLFRLNLGLGF